MKKLLLMLVMGLSMLVGCGSEEENVSPEEIENRIAFAIDEMGDNTNLEIIESGMGEDGYYDISLSDETIFRIKDNVVHAANVPTAPEEDITQSFRLLFGVVDPELSMSERNTMTNDLLVSDKDEEYISNNDISYVYQSADQAIILRAEY